MEEQDPSSPPDDEKPALVCVHGFMDSPRSWDLVGTRLEQRFQLLTPGLPGHYGGPQLDVIDEHVMADSVEAAMDDAGIGTAKLAGNSLGAYVALQLAERGRASSVVAFAPAGPDAAPELFERQRSLHRAAQTTAANADRLLATPAGRRAATELLVEHYEHIPTELIAHLMLGVARAEVEPLLHYAASASWPLDPELITCPVRFVWGSADRLLPWPAAAAHYQRLFPHADWVVLDGVGHAPQLDVPLEAAELIAGF
jgi:pimeloyl-ACP methyl ester carboxylesterase